MTLSCRIHYWTIWVALDNFRNSENQLEKIANDYYVMGLVSILVVCAQANYTRKDHEKNTEDSINQHRISCFFFISFKVNPENINEKNLHHRISTEFIQQIPANQMVNTSFISFSFFC